MRYELIREIFNKCSGNQMRDVFVSEVETADPEAYVREMVVGTNVTVDGHRTDAGALIFEVVSDGLRQRFSFTED